VYDILVQCASVDVEVIGS